MDDTEAMVVTSESYKKFEKSLLSSNQCKSHNSQNYYMGKGLGLDLSEIDHAFLIGFKICLIEI